MVCSDEGGRVKLRVGRMQEVLHHGTYGLIVDTYYELTYRITFIGLGWGFNTFGITVYKRRTECD